METTVILKQVAKSHSALAELKGVSHIIPNEKILVQTLALQEVWKSSEIENIVTTQDHSYGSDIQADHFLSNEAKQKVWKENYYINDGLLRLLVLGNSEIMNDTK